MFSHGRLGCGMGERVATIVIEPRLLVREALVSLMAAHSYHVVSSFASTTDIESSPLAADPPELVIFGALPTRDAVTSATGIRKLWAKTKIILLFEHATSADFQKLLASEINGCISLSASPETFIGTIRQITAADLTIVVYGDATCSPMPCKADWQQDDGSYLRINNLARSTSHEVALISPSSVRPSVAPAVSKKMVNGAVGSHTSGGTFHSLSKREEQILIGLIKGHSNKIIAVTCDVTEATIKVHMKSILKKLRVENRTQAAIWALEQGYCADKLNQVARGTAAQ
jgi:two-component system, NarL family, nitrate/nitrite response regulator NarL